MNWSLHFLGVGAAHAVELGSSAVVLEHDGKPVLLIDCGPDTLDRYLAAYGEPPHALYITHTHMDHIGGMERLFFRLWFDEQWRGRTQVFVHAGLVPWLQARVADYPNLWNYTRDLYQVPGIAETVSIDHIKRHYYGSQRQVNPTGIVPIGPVIDFAAPHDRARFG